MNRLPSFLNARFLILASLLALLGFVAIASSSAADSSIQSLDLTWAAEDFREGQNQNTIATSEGLTLALSARTGRYISPVIDSPLPFNAVVPQWLAEVPDASRMTVQLRTGKADGTWDDWQLIPENDDWMEEGDEEVIGQMIAVPAVDVTREQIQFAIDFNRINQAGSPLVQRVRLTLIDSTQGPTAEQMLQSASELESEKPNSPQDGYPKPAVIPRSVWCTDPACNYSDGLEYEPVTHLIVHHTVSSNSSSDWAAVVRAIWYFHTFTRGWGDIGYNYLVDMNGTLYEGHLGGDDVVGTHAAGANEGSMALAFIGTFTEPDQTPPGITPPPAMLNSAIELFAWKADQKNIDVFDASRLPNVDWGLPHLMGHRDVYGTTVCPGDQAQELLIWLRNEVANRIGFVSPYLYVDELSDAFILSNTPYWYTPPGDCGFNLHAYYTWSVSPPANPTSWGEWRPPVTQAGWYEVQSYAPYCITGRAETDGASYTITHANGSNTIVVSHEDNVGTWMSLGTYYFNAGTSGVIRLTDLTTTDSGLGVWFDAIRLRPLNPGLIPTVTNVNPVSESFLTTREVNFQWQVQNATAVQTTRLQVATDPQFSNLVLNQSFSGAPTFHNHTFAADYSRLYWRVLMTTYDNHTAASTTTWFGIDTVAPTSQVEGIVRVEDSHYALHWSGSDQASGIESYLVQYQAQGESQWHTLLNGTDWTSTYFYPPDGQVYWFRTQATDRAGHVEPEHPGGDMSTEQAIQVYRDSISPLIFR